MSEAVVEAPLVGRSRFRVGDPLPKVLTKKDVGDLLGYSVTQAWRLEKAGAFRQFELPSLTVDGTTLSGVAVKAPRRYSGKLIQDWLDAGGAPLRYFGSARRR